MMKRKIAIENIGLFTCLYNIELTLEHKPKSFVSCPSKRDSSGRQKVLYKVAVLKKFLKLTEKLLQ